MLLAMLLAASSQLPTVFGLQLGAPVALPECRRMVLRYPTPGELPPYQTEQTETCQQLPDPKYAPERGAVVFLAQKMPEIAGSNWMLTTIIGGRLEGVYAATLDYNNASEIIRQLTLKFGSPTKVEDEEVVVDHIALPSRHAVWARPGYTVDYHSIGSRIARGHLAIETDAGRALREASERAQVKQSTPI